MTFPVRHIRFGLAIGACTAIAVFSSFANAQTPQRGGIFTFAPGSAPNTLDCHAFGSSLLMPSLAPAYSTLIRFDPENYPKIIGDLAKSWTISADRLTYTFKLVPSVTFHDGSAFSSADIKATYDRLRNPPSGVTSLRQSQYASIASIDTPDPLTVVFKLSKPNPQMQLTFASPYGCVYSAKKLAENPKFPETNVMGTGPFKFVEYVSGSSITFTRNENYFVKGLPYLDGLKGVFVIGQGFVNALAGGQVDGAYSTITPATRDSISASRGNKTVFPESPYNVINMIDINNTKAPLNDVRVRRALQYALDRRAGDLMVQKISAAKGFGVLFADGVELDMSREEMEKLPGYGPDMTANRAEARKLLAEAGQSDLKLTLLNRNIGGSYAALGVYLIDQLRQVGVTVEQRVLETGPFFAGLSSLNFDLAIDAYPTISGDPSEVLDKYLPDSNLNYTGAKDPILQELYDKQAIETNPVERKRLVTEFQKRVVEQAHLLPMFRSINIGAMASNVKGWKILPNPALNVDARTIWFEKN